MNREPIPAPLWLILAAFSVAGAILGGALLFQGLIAPDWPTRLGSLVIGAAVITLAELLWQALRRGL